MHHVPFIPLQSCPQALAACIVVVVVLETTAAPGQPHLPMALVGWVRVLHYHVSMAHCPKMMKAVAARIAVGLAAHVRLARSPVASTRATHAENTPPVSHVPGAPRAPMVRAARVCDLTLERC